MKILITGRGGAGTKLIHRLFFAFKYTNVLYEEIPPDVFAEMPEEEGVSFTVTKRRNLPSQGCLFSKPISTKETMRQANMLRAAGVKILTIIRNESILDNRPDEADDYYRVMTRTWLNLAYVDCLVRFEDLVTRPMNVQEQLQWAFGLTRKHDFTEYPDFLPDKILSRPQEKIHAFRPIGVPRYEKEGPYIYTRKP
jgi:hypothetical protein